MINVRYIREEDKSFWFTLDKHLSEIEFEKKYRKMGFQDAGGLLINIPKYEQPMEMFFIKEIS